MLRKLFSRSFDTALSYGILHNRKTGGTALRDVIKQHTRMHPDATLRSFGHSMTFPRFNKKYPHAKVIFFIREPLSRFVSGFYSRLRQGQPRYNTPWNKQEAKAFAYFKTPNALAEALSSEQFAIRRRALHAMRAIGHVRHTYMEFLGSLAFLEEHAHKIFFIGHQAEFDADFTILRTRLNIDSQIALPQDDVGAHRNPASADKFLSATAIRNLEKWYALDIEIYQWCLKKRAQLLS